MSRSLYTMSADIRASGRKAGAGEEAKQLRYYLKAGGQYLHFSGLHLTSVRSQAWIGSIEQARACRRTFPAAAGCRTHPIISIPKHVQELA
jgi:hypothetical protein